jgi:hypothetical protein
MIEKIYISITVLSVLSIASANASEKMPISAKAGQCFTKSFYPPQYTKVTKIKSTKRVLLNDASVKYEVIPAKYTIYEEKVKISDGKEKIVTTPAVYKTVYERILIEPKKQVWRESLNVGSKKAFNSCVQSASTSGMDIGNAKVGTCFYEHFQAEKYINTTSKILTADASERVVVIPATYTTSIKKIVTDSTSVKLLPSGAVYKKIVDKVVIAPAKAEWKKTICGDTGCNQSEVVCLTEVPTTYKKITKRIVLQPAVTKSVSVTPSVKTLTIEQILTPARSERIAIPPKYTTISQRKKIQDSKYYWSGASTEHASSRIQNQCNKICLTATPAKYKKVAKQILVRPVSVRKVKTPEKYTMVKIKKIEQKASYKKIVIPKEYITVATERERTRGYAKWMPMICEEMLTPSIIKKVQRALQFKGFYQGAIDGIWNLKSKSATRAYQKENGLAITNKLSIETMKALSIY